jgi:hypothetical protein
MTRRKCRPGSWEYESRPATTLSRRGETFTAKGGGKHPFSTTRVNIRAPFVLGSQYRICQEESEK